MGTEDAARAITRSEVRGSVALWFGALGGAGAWLLHLVANYSLEEWFACSPSSQTSGRILGVGVDTVSVASNAVSLGLATAAAVTALACVRKLAQAGDEASTERARWMAGAGLFADLVFIAMIAWGFAPPLILGVCEAAP